MMIKVSELDEQGLSVTDPSVLGRAYSDPSWRLERVSLQIDPDGTDVFVHGVVGATVPQTCSRCLEPFRLPVAERFDLRYLPVSEASSDAEREVDDEDLETSYYENDAIDLNELLREQFYLVLPMKPLCKEDCRGLCAQCGTNLNTGTCDCAPVWEDPRLAPLRGLGRIRES